MKKVENKINKEGYSLIGIIATIVGVVVGIGIFFKVGSIVPLTGSILSIFAWIIGATIVGCMLISYIEIASSTSKTGEIGSLSTWANKFINNKVAKIIGLFLTLVYFPGILVLLSSISAFFLMSSIQEGNSNAISGIWEQFGFIIGIMIFLLIGSFLINVYSKKTGEKIQVIGTIIKFIPFVIVIIVGFIMGVANLGGLKDSSIDHGNTPSAGNAVNGLFLAMPAILFSFDGFIYAANLQNEMKDKKKFPKAIFISLIIVVMIYILIAIMSVWLGTKSDEYSIPGILNSIFGKQKWLSVIVILIISLSGMTGLNGFMMTSLRGFKSLSESKIIYDKDKSFQKENKNGMAMKSAIAIAISIGVWFTIFLSSELIRFATDEINYGSSWKWTDTYDKVIMANVIIANFSYVVIIFGAIQNRKSNKVEVDKMKYFLPIAWVGFIGVSFFSIYNIAGIIAMASGGLDGDQISNIISISVLVVEVLVLIWLYFINEKYLKNNKDTKKIEITKKISKSK